MAADHDPSLIVGRFWQTTDSSSNQSGFLECEVFPICERTILASNLLPYPQELTVFVYVLVLCGPGLGEAYVVLFRKRYEAFHDLSLIVGRFGQFTNFSSNQFGFLEREVFSLCECTILSSKRESVLNNGSI